MQYIIFDVSSLTGLLGACQCSFVFAFFCYSMIFEHDDAQIQLWAVAMFFCGWVLILGGGLAMRELREIKRKIKHVLVAECFSMTISVLIVLVVHYWVSVSAQAFVDRLRTGENLLKDGETMRMLHFDFLKRFKKYKCEETHDDHDNVQLKRVKCKGAHTYFTNRFATWFEEVCNKEAHEGRYNACVNLDIETWEHRSDGPNPFWTGTGELSQSDLKVVGVGIVDQASADEYEKYPILRIYANGSDNYDLGCRSDGHQSEAYALLYRADDNPLEPEFASFESWISGAPIGKPTCMFHFRLLNVSLYPKPNCHAPDLCPRTENFQRVKLANVLHFVDTNDAARSLTYHLVNDTWIYKGGDSPAIDIRRCACTQVGITGGTWTLSRRTSTNVIVEGDSIPLHTKGHPAEPTNIRGVFTALPKQVEIVREQVYGNPAAWRFKASSAFVEAPYIAEMNRSSHRSPPEDRMVDVRWITPADRPHVTNYSLHWRTDLGIGSRLPSILRSDKKNPEQYDLVYHVSAGWYQAVPHINFVKNCTLVDDTESVCVFYWNEVDASIQNVTIIREEHKMEVRMALNFDGLGKFDYMLTDSYVPSNPLPSEKIAHIKKLSDYMDAIRQPFVEGEKKQFILKSCPNSVFIKKGEKFEPRYYKLVLPLGSFPTNNTILTQVCPECAGITNGRKCLPDIVGDQRKQYLPREPYSYLEWNHTHWKHYVRRFCIASNFRKPGYSTGELGDYALVFVAPSAANGSASNSSYQQIMNAKWQKRPLRSDQNIANQVWPNPGRVGLYLPAFVSEPGNRVFCEVFVNFAGELQEKTEELIKWVLSFMVLEGTCLCVFIFVYMKKHTRRCWH